MVLQSAAVMPSQAARPLRHWPDAALARARARVEQAWSDWCARWQLASGAVTVLNACDDERVPGAAWQRVADHPLWLTAVSRHAEAPGNVVQAMLFRQGGAPSSPVARDVAAEAIADLMRSLAQLADARNQDKRSVRPGETPSIGDSHRWSGSLSVRIEAVGADSSTSWCLHCGDAVASALCGGTPSASTRTHAPLVDVTEALRRQPLDFKVCFEESPLTLGSLQSLRVGDVLPLAHRLDQPLRVVAPSAAGDAPLFCAAYLGSRNTFRAVELVSAAPASNSSDS